VIHYLASVATKMEDVNKEYKKYIYTWSKNKTKKIKKIDV
jgi:hypothetical protein